MKAYYVETQNQSLKLQEYLFEEGYHWSDFTKEVKIPEFETYLIALGDEKSVKDELEYGYFEWLDSDEFKEYIKTNKDNRNDDFYFGKRLFTNWPKENMQYIFADAIKRLYMIPIENSLDSPEYTKYEIVNL